MEEATQGTTTPCPVSLDELTREKRYGLIAREKALDAEFRSLMRAVEHNEHETIWVWEELASVYLQLASGRETPVVLDNVLRALDQPRGRAESGEGRDEEGAGDGLAEAEREAD